MTNEELVAEIQQGHNVKENMQQLYDQNYGIIRSICYKFSRTTNACELDDLLQESYFPLKMSVDRFDQSKGYKFFALAVKSIEYYLQTYIDGLSLISTSYGKSQIRKCKRFIREYELLNNGEHPADEQVSKGTGISVQRIQELKKLEQLQSNIDIDGMVPGTDKLTYKDMLSDKSDIEQEYIDREQRQKAVVELWQQCDRLGKRQSDILKKRFQEDKSLSEIGKEYSITKEGVRQIVQKACKQLYENKTIKEIAKIFDYDCYVAFHGGVGMFKRTGTSNTEYLAIRAIENMNQGKDSELLNRLDYWGKLVFIFHYHEKRSIAQIAKECGCSKRTIQRIKAASFQQVPELMDYYDPQE